MTLATVVLGSDRLPWKVEPLGVWSGGFSVRGTLPSATVVGLIIINPFLNKEAVVY